MAQLSQGLDASRIQESLREISMSAVRELDVPESTFDTPSFDMSQSMFSYPFVSDDRDLYFENFYGNVHMHFIGKNMKMVAVNRKGGDANPRRQYMDDIRRQVTKVVNSIPHGDIDHATLSISLEKIYFAVSYQLSAKDEKNFLRHGAIFDGPYGLRIRPYRFINTTKVTCEWQKPHAVISLIKDSGAEQISHDAIEPRVDLLLRGRHLERSVDANRRQYFGHRLSLDAESLAAKEWRIQNWNPMTCFFMHARPTSNDVIVRAHVERVVSIDDVRRRMSVLPTMLDGPGLGGWLKRKDVGYRGETIDRGMKFVIEYMNGEKFTFKLKGVIFTITLQTVNYYYYDQKENDFSLTDHVMCEGTLHFHCTQSRSDLIEAVAHLVHVLLQNSNNNKVMPLTTPMLYSYDSSGARVSSEDMQAVLRLKYENGPLYQLLGLEHSASKDLCRQKALELMSFMEECRGYHLVSWLKIKIDNLVRKLREAAARKGIDL